jgi:DNA mismatch repair protein MutS
MSAGPETRVRIDRETLADLEILATRRGEPGLVRLVDRTVTTRGHRALCRRLTAPASDPVAIRAAQEAVRFLGRHPRLLRIDSAMLDEAAAYLDSNIAVGGSSRWRARAEHADLAVLHRDVLRELRRGVETVTGVFDRAVRVCRAIEEREPPPLLSEAVQRLDETAARVGVAAGLSGGLPRVDRVLRRDLRQEIDESLDLLAEIDALSGMAEASRSLGWTFPEILSGDRFVLEVDDLRHPLLYDGVGNPAALGSGTTVVFLTGPNMAGKTTWLRAVATSVVLAQAGMAVPASRMRLTPVEVLVACLSPTDDLAAGKSTFLAELERVRSAASHLADGRRALLVFDEIFRGTNLQDALDASREVILGLARSRRGGVLVASHLSELADALRAAPGVRFLRLEGDAEDGVLRWSYRIREGVSEQRLGMALLRQVGIPEILERISDA